MSDQCHALPLPTVCAADLIVSPPTSNSGRHRTMANLSKMDIRPQNRGSNPSCVLLGGILQFGLATSGSSSVASVGWISRLLILPPSHVGPAATTEPGTGRILGCGKPTSPNQGKKRKNWLAALRERLGVGGIIGCIAALNGNFAWGVPAPVTVGEGGPTPCRGGGEGMFNPRVFATSFKAFESFLSSFFVFPYCSIIT